MLVRRRGDAFQRGGISQGLARSFRKNRCGGLAVRAYVVVLAVLLSNCSASDIIQDWTVAPAPDLSQPDYRRIVGESIDRLLPHRKPTDELEISEMRRVDQLTGPAWIVCLRVDARRNPKHLAIFIRGDKILDWRSGLVIDGCHKASYVPLEVTAHAETKSGK
jgi:hypothetical protein